MSRASASLTWVLEREVFADDDVLRAAAARAEHAVIDWSDDWWEGDRWPRLAGPVLFHGSLGNADRIRRELPWSPGSLCATEALRCSSWYAPDPAVVIDVCEADGDLRLLELNPFSGADLYACDGDAIVASLAEPLAKA